VTDREATIFGLALGAFGVWLMTRPREVAEGGSLWQSLLSSRISRDEATRYATAAGFQGDALAIVVAIAQAESGLRPLVIADNLTSGEASVRYRGDPPPEGVSSSDRGILQINDRWHPEVTDDEAFDPAAAFVAGYAVSHSGSDFTPWSTYKNGAYQRFL